MCPITILKQEMDYMVLHDIDIREPLFLYLENLQDKVRFLEEKKIGRARADIVMILPDKVCGIEIKSDADSYTRLPSQIHWYDRFFDENYTVVGSTHASHAHKHVPDYWGIISVEYYKGHFDFLAVRNATPNSNSDIRYKMSILWRKELKNMIIRNKLRGFSMPKRKMIDRLIERVPNNELQKQISDELFERDYTIFQNK
jgi:hypothetical protein